ncbi:MAG: hypothetical protein QN198_01815 [Armatimonadota bacterium]|nr:hypothetical protein [Armatimonadota bacterium]MDR5702323.1 hypothetical protein [Armatimonadota bacterium]MDR7435932.1 hypothetical protein [Armatimonadota bacterium]
MREHQQILRTLNGQRWSELQTHRRILQRVQEENRHALGIARRVLDAERARIRADAQWYREVLANAKREAGVHREALALARAEAQLYRRALEQAKEDAKTLLRLVTFIQRFAGGVLARRAA